MLITTAAALGGCAEFQSPLVPHGPAARAINDVWWIMFWVATAIFVLVIAIMLGAIFRRRHGTTPNLRQGVSPGDGIGWVLLGGVVLPVVVLVPLLVLALVSGNAASFPPTSPAVIIEVDGKLWWWEVRYPEHDVITANEIHIPVGQPVQINLRSDNVIHSFWVPPLQGKTDLIPGHTNTTWIQADTPGVYRGFCTEYCGLQHANMLFEVVAEPPDEFQAWLARQQEPPAQPTEGLEHTGMVAFMRPSCMGCHTIAGTPAQGTIGPNLSHVGSRRTIVSGTLPRNRGTLAGFIADPQGVKPGNLMPDLNVHVEDAHAIAAYLDSLK